MFVAEGIWREDQVDPSYDGSPARFIAEDGTIAQQGFASAEPYLYENVFEDWVQPVAYQMLHDAGFQIYSQTLAIRPDDLETLRPCLEAFVPVVQQAAVDFVTDPTRTNAIDRRRRRAVRHVLDVHARARRLLRARPRRELGLIGNGPDDTHRQHRRRHASRRVLAAGPRRRPRGARRSRRPTDLYTNEFIDETIGL